MDNSHTLRADRHEYRDDEALEINKERDEIDPSKSPDLSKLHPLRVGKTTYYFSTPEKLEAKKEEVRKDAEMIEARLRDRESEIKEAVSVEDWISDNNLTCGMCVFSKMSEDSGSWVCTNDKTKCFSKFNFKRRIQGEHTRACRFIKFKA
jgi:hypothetical protein